VFLKEIKVVSGGQVIAVYNARDKAAAIRWAAKMAKVRKCKTEVHVNDAFVKAFDGR
jgi:hypothetical protein